MTAVLGGTCGRCREPLDNRGIVRGLHRRCYAAASKDGTLADHDRTYRRGADVMGDLRALVARDPEITCAEAALALGMTVAAVKQVVARARRRGVRWTWPRTPGRCAS